MNGEGFAYGTVGRFGRDSSNTPILCRYMSCIPFKKREDAHDGAIYNDLQVMKVRRLRWFFYSCSSHVKIRVHEYMLEIIWSA